MALRFPLKQMIIGMQAAGFAVTLPVLGLLLATPVFADEPVVDAKKMEKEFEDHRYLDWVPVEELTEEQKKTVPNSCCKGAYVPPLRTDTDVEMKPEQAPIRAHADEQISEAQTRVQFKGNVSITQGNRSITTESATFDKTTNQAELSGGIQLRDPNIMVRAESGTTNVETGEAQFENTRFVLYESRIHGVAARLQKFGNNVINLEQSVISSCEPGDNAWSIRGAEISLHPDESYGTAKNMRINIQDIPIVYLPYVRFPVGNERLTGFLTPTPGYSERNGWELAVPFYWNIAPNLDATIAPHYFSNRGFMLDTGIRHLSRYFETEVHNSVINNDRGGFSSYQESLIAQGEKVEDVYPYRGHDRWYANLEQRGGLGQNWSTNISYADLSDTDFIRDMDNSSVEFNRQSYIRQTASADYRSEHWFTGIKLDEYRLLTPSQLPYRDLPRIHADGNYHLGDWIIQLNNSYVNFAQNRNFESSFDPKTSDYATALLNTIYGERFNTDYSLTWNKSYAWGFIKPGVAVKGLAYQLNTYSLVIGADPSPSFVVPQVSVDTGLYFDREVHLFGRNYLQTLEPRAFYFYSEYKNQDSLYKLTRNQQSYIYFDSSDLSFNYNQLFRTTRFAGGDRLDDANQVSLAVSTAFQSKDSGIERLRLSIGQIFYANDRQVTTYDKNPVADPTIPNSVVNAIDPNILAESTRPTSDWAAQVSGQINSRFRLSADTTYDPRNDRFDSTNMGMHYMDDAYRIFNLEYRYTLKPVLSSPNQPIPTQVQSMNQLDTSFILPINSRWSIIARNNHDFTHNVELDTFAGLEYNDCCYRVKVIARRWLRVDYTTPDFLANLTGDDFEPAFMVELELKGLGSMDKRISSLLDKTVTGFKDREKNLR